MSDSTEIPISCIDSGDTAWLIVSTILVSMQIPALAIMQSGAIRKKNSLSILLQVMTCLSVGSILWYIIGYSMSFGTTRGGVIGWDFDKFVYNDVKYDDCIEGQSIPEILFSAFQMMFALIAVATPSGAFAEKLTFKASLLFFILWPIFCYYPIANMVWGGGLLAGYHWKELVVLDFAGDHVIHTNVGMAGLVIAYVLKPRKYAKLETTQQAHNIPLIVIGAALTYIGWFGFNAGSGLAADGLASITLMNTHISSITSSLVWLFLAYTNDHKFHITEFVSGWLAGLAGITGGSGFVPVWGAVTAGFLSGLASYYFSRWISKKDCFDDVLDVSSLQLVAGSVGAMIPGFFAKKDIGGADGLVYGKPMQAVYQLIGLITVLAWSAICTYTILRFIDWLVGLDLSEEARIKGLDIVEYGDVAYISIDKEATIDDIIDAAKNGNLENLKRIFDDFDIYFGESDYDNRTPLMLACENEHMEVIKFLLEREGVDVNAIDNFGNTPLNISIKFGFDKISTFLRENGAVDSNDHLVGQQLSVFASNNNLEKIEQYHRSGVDLNTSDYDQRTALHIASAFGHIQIVRYLLEFGANVNCEDRFHSTPLNEAYKHDEDDEELIELIKSHGGKLNDILDVDKICACAAAGHIKEIKKYVETNPQIVNLTDYDRRSLVTLAVSNGHFKLVKYLVDNGADVNIVDKFGMTALDESIKYHNEYIYNYLLDHNAIINQKNIGIKLCQLVSENDLDTIKHYVNAGVNINACDYDQRTALHIAVEDSRVDVVKYLLDNGANPDIEDRFMQNCFLIIKKLYNNPNNGNSTNFNEQISNLLDEYKQEKRSHLKIQCRNFGVI